MATQYTFGIEDRTEDELLKLLPSRFSKAALMRMGNAELLTMRNLVQRLQGAYQTLRDASRISDYLAAIETELDRRRMTDWLSIPCPVCHEHLRIERDTTNEVEGGELVGYCQCTDALNNTTQPAIYEQAR